MLSAIWTRARLISPTSRLVDKLASAAVESKETDAQLFANLFSRAVAKSLCSPAALQEGLSSLVEIMYDIAIDATRRLLSLP